jgi:hypothetical protein
VTQRLPNHFRDLLNRLDQIEEMITRPGERRPGIGIDASGGQVIDPTKNVENLVKAGQKSVEEILESDRRFLDARLADGDKFHSFARKAEARFQNSARLYESIYQNGMRESETRRIDQLAATRQEFQNTIRDMLAESVRTTSTLVSTQLVQIQATFDTRVSKLEAGAFTQAGKSSVADPAFADALMRMEQRASNQATKQDEALSRMTLELAAIRTTESRVGGRDMGKMDTNARLLAVVMAVAAVASPVIAILVTIMAMRGK